MQRFQIRVRLSKATTFKLKAQAKRHGLSLDSMCGRILEDGALKLAAENYSLLSGNALRAKVDIANSRLRSISNLEKRNVEYHQYPQETATYIFNQLSNTGGFS
jgi:hypothetical protein